MPSNGLFIEDLLPRGWGGRGVSDLKKIRLYRKVCYKNLAFYSTCCECRQKCVKCWLKTYLVISRLAQETWKFHKHFVVFPILQMGPTKFRRSKNSPTEHSSKLHGTTSWVPILLLVRSFLPSMSIRLATFRSATRWVIKCLLLLKIGFVLLATLIMMVV